MIKKILFSLKKLNKNLKKLKNDKFNLIKNVLNLT
jgi:hypothetical protein